MKRNTPVDATLADSRAALLEGYKSAQWTAFAFAMFCEFLEIFLEWGEAYVRVFFLGSFFTRCFVLERSWDRWT